MTDAQAQPCKPLALLGYEAETARLKALTEFLVAFVPSLTERAEPGTEEVGDDLAPEVRTTRDRAIVEAFLAVELIAQSWPPIEPDPEYDPEGEPSVILPPIVAEAAA